MPTHRQYVVEVPSTNRGNGSSDTASLKKAYPASPVYGGGDNDPSYSTDEAVQEFFEQAVLGATVNDGGHTFGTFNRDYAEAPNLEEVETGGGGLPGGPYAPNVASPTELGQNPADIPAEGAEVTETARGSGGPFDGDGLASPHRTKENISGQTLGSLVFGESEPSS